MDHFEPNYIFIVAKIASCFAYCRYVQSHVGSTALEFQIDRQSFENNWTILNKPHAIASKLPAIAFAAGNTNAVSADWSICIALHCITIERPTQNVDSRAFKVISFALIKDFYYQCFWVNPKRARVQLQGIWSSLGVRGLHSSRWTLVHVGPE